MGVYEYDHTLPQLPIPPLAESREGLALRVQPLVDEEAFAKFTEALDNFCAAGGEGPRLQEKLCEWQASLPGNSSWLRPFWDDSYIASRASLPKSLNYTLQLRRERWGENALGQFVVALAHCIRRLREESLPAEMAKSYASMDTLQSMIYTRVPHPGRDIWYSPPLAAPMKAAVACRGHWFLLGLTDASGWIHPPAAIARGIARIKAEAAALPPALPVSAYTCLGREEAARLRAGLSGHMLNRLSLESVEKTVFAVCLDEDDLDEVTFGAGVVAGDAANRWFDKSLLVINSGEQLGVSLEHSGCDGSLWAYMLGQVDQQVERAARSPSPAGEMPYIHRLEWVVADEVAAELIAARDEFGAWGDEMRFSQRRIESVNKEAIKALGCGPDAFIQMLFQNAFYRQSGRIRSFYEAVSARAFYQGRTENIRTCTAESVALMQALEADASDEELRDKLMAALAAHSRDITRCKQGLGCERHMSGLRAIHNMVTPDAPEPALFATEGYQTLIADAMSTSSITGPAVDYFAFAPVVADGIGLGYGLNADALHVAVTAYEASGVDPAAFLEEVERTGARLFAALAG